MNLNKRELATVLYSLRKTQETLHRHGMDSLDDKLHFAPKGIKPLTQDEIDGLCERLNTDPKTRKR